MPTSGEPQRRGRRGRRRGQGDREAARLVPSSGRRWSVHRPRSIADRTEPSSTSPAPRRTVAPRRAAAGSRRTAVGRVRGAVWVGLAAGVVIALAAGSAVYASSSGRWRPRTPRSLRRCASTSRYSPRTRRGRRAQRRRRRHARRVPGQPRRRTPRRRPSSTRRSDPRGRPERGDAPRAPSPARPRPSRGAHRPGPACGRCARSRPASPPREGRGRRPGRVAGRRERPHRRRAGGGRRRSAAAAAARSADEAPARSTARSTAPRPPRGVPAPVAPAASGIPAGGKVCSGSGGSGAGESSAGAIGTAINAYRASLGLPELSVSAQRRPDVARDQHGERRRHLAQRQRQHRGCVSSGSASRWSPPGRAPPGTTRRCVARTSRAWRRRRRASTAGCSAPSSSADPARRPHSWAPAATSADVACSDVRGRVAVARTRPRPCGSGAARSADVAATCGLSGGRPRGGRWPGRGPRA